MNVESDEIRVQFLRTHESRDLEPAEPEPREMRKPIMDHLSRVRFPDDATRTGENHAGSGTLTIGPPAPSHHSPSRRGMGEIQQEENEEKKRSIMKNDCLTTEKGQRNVGSRTEEALGTMNGMASSWSVSRFEHATRTEAEEQRDAAERGKSGNVGLAGSRGAERSITAHRRRKKVLISDFLPVLMHDGAPLIPQWNETRTCGHVASGGGCQQKRPRGRSRECGPASQPVSLPACLPGRQSRLS